MLTVEENHGYCLLPELDVKKKERSRWSLQADVLILIQLPTPPDKQRRLHNLSWSLYTYIQGE